MNSAKRIIIALKFLSELRTSIDRKGGKYTGMESPNFQSIMDILTVPDALLETQEFPPMFLPAPGEEGALVRNWAAVTW